MTDAENEITPPEGVWVVVCPQGHVVLDTRHRHNLALKRRYLCRRCENYTARDFYYRFAGGEKP